MIGAKMAETELKRTSENADVKKENDNTKTGEESAAALPPHKEYVKRLADNKEKYIQTLIMALAFSATGIVIAIIEDLLIGIALALLAAVLYVRFASDAMYKTLGFRYSTYTHGMKLTLCRACYGDVMWIPARLNFFEVTRIEDHAFKTKHNAELRCVFLPRTLKSIGKDVFEDCGALCDVFYEGSEEEWKKIETETDLSSYRVVFDAKYPPMPKKKKKKK